MVFPAGSGNELAPANLPHQLRLTPHVAAVQVQPVAVGIHAGNGLPVELAEQNVRQRLQHRRRSARQQIGNAHAQPPVFQTDEAVRVGEAAELYLQFGYWRARLQLAEYTRVSLFRHLEEQGAFEALKVERPLRVGHLSPAERKVNEGARPPGATGSSPSASHPSRPHNSGARGAPFGSRILRNMPPLRGSPT